MALGATLLPAGTGDAIGARAPMDTAQPTAPATGAATATGGGSPAPPGTTAAGPPGDIFASVLSDQVARTALAEGPAKQSPNSERRPSTRWPAVRRIHPRHSDR
jgi:hypothetical protein